MRSTHEISPHLLEHSGAGAQLRYYSELRKTNKPVEALTIFDAQLVENRDMPRAVKLALMKRILDKETKDLDSEDSTMTAIKPFVRQNRHDTNLYIRSTRIRNGRHCRSHKT